MSKKQGTVGIHLVFLTLLGGMLLLKYGLYFASPITGTGMTPARMGATASHLLVWGLVYATCLHATSKILVGFLGVGSVVVGTLTLPLLGWGGLFVTWVVKRVTQTEDADAEVPQRDLEPVG